MKSKRFILTLASILLIALSCSRLPSKLNPEAQTTGSANITIDVGKVGALAKSAKTTEIVLESLYVAIFSDYGDTIQKAYKLSGHDKNTISSIYENLKPNEWKLSVYSKDNVGTVIHQGSTKFTIEVQVECAPETGTELGIN